MWNKQVCLCKSCLKWFLETTLYKQWGLNFLLKEKNRSLQCSLNSRLTCWIRCFTHCALSYSLWLLSNSQDFRQQDPYYIIYRVLHCQTLKWIRRNLIYDSSCASTFRICSWWLSNQRIQVCGNVSVISFMWWSWIGKLKSKTWIDFWTVCYNLYITHPSCVLQSGYVWLLHFMSLQVMTSHV